MAPDLYADSGINRRRKPTEGRLTGATTALLIAVTHPRGVSLCLEHRSNVKATHGEEVEIACE
jgi:hypothetical protein